MRVGYSYEMKYMERAKILIGIYSPKDWKRIKIFGSVTLILIVSALFLCRVYFRQEFNLLRIEIFSVGSRVGMFIETPHGGQVLVNTGNSSEIIRTLGSFMPWYDKNLDAILVAQNDTAHAGVLGRVLERYATNILGVTDFSSLSNFVNFSELKRQILEKKEMVRGQEIFLDNVRIKIFFPDRPSNVMATSTSAIVFKLVYGSTSLVFAGDAAPGVRSFLSQEDSENLVSDILVQDRSEYTKGEDVFVRAIHPRVRIAAQSSRTKVVSGVADGSVAGSENYFVSDATYVQCLSDKIEMKCAKIFKK